MESRAHVLLVGAGGLGSPAGRVLARSPGVARLTLVDDDVVDASNLHRQTLFGLADVGAPKAERAARALRAEANRAGRSLEVAAVEGRFVPETAETLLAGVDLVVEGADNFATKFLVADACGRARIPSVSAGCVRWAGWALATVPGRSACLRCVFEDVPARLAAAVGAASGPPETCADAGVVGPAVGALGAIEAVLALRLLHGDVDAAGVIWRLDTLAGRVRATPLRPRSGCVACARAFPPLTLESYAAPAGFAACS
jgi:molybdopterin/thiamine biosynthesis adenylyltransferase